MNPDELRKLANDDVLFLEAHGFDADLLGKTQRRILAAAAAWEADRRERERLEGVVFDLLVERDALRLRLEAAEKRLTPFLHHGINCPCRGMLIGAEGTYTCDCGLLAALNERLEAAEKIVDVLLVPGYEAEANTERLISELAGYPSNHRSFEAYKAERLAALKENP